MEFALTSRRLLPLEATLQVVCVWLKLMLSMNWIVLEDFEVGMWRALRSVDIIAVDLKATVQWVIVVSKADVTWSGSS